MGNLKLSKWIVIAGILLVSSQGLAAMSVQETISTKKNPWSASLFSLISTELDSSQDGGAAWSAYNYLSFNRRIDFKSKAAIRVPFIYSTYGYDRFNRDRVTDQELFLQDIFFSYANYNVVLLPGDIEVFWEGRLYVPTSDHSRNIKMIARLRNDFILSKLVARGVELGYIQKVNYYHQSRTVYENSFIGDEGDMITVPSLTKSFYVDHWAELWLSFTSSFGIGAKIGSEDTWWNKSEFEQRKKEPEHLAKLGAQIKFALNRKANFILSIDNKVNNRDEMDDFGKFRPEQTELVLLSFLRF